jgi:hypothetical protein
MQFGVRFALSLASAAAFLCGCAGTQPRLAPDARKGPADIHSVIPESTVGARPFAVALAGGGTKAASYAMGVLGALAEKDKLKDTGAISTVSGGSYAAFFLYSKLLHDSKVGEPDALRNAKRYFEDCIPGAYADVLPGAKLCGDNAHIVYPFQRHIRCRQDILEDPCEPEAFATDGSEWINTLGLAWATTVAQAPNFIARSLFDWPVNLSPSRSAYRHGLATVYGLYPIKAMLPGQNTVDACRNGQFVNCAPGSDVLLDRETLAFANLKPLHEKGGAPLWVLNSTATPSRSIFSWATHYSRDFEHHIFQMSPYAMRSEHFGHVELDRDFDLLEATTTSAAFLDTNELSLGQPWRLIAALGLHFGALDWGIDVPNPNVGAGYRTMHILLPFPLYYLDGGLRLSGGKSDRNDNSSFIRLLDGGSEDNLGAYTLIEAGFKTILISDHAADRYGEMVDVCRLKHQLATREKKPRLKLIMPALAHLDDVCAPVARDSAGCEREPHLCGLAEKDERIADEKKLRYPMHAWSLPVVLGCAVPESQNECDDKPSTIRILLLKPAFDLKKALAQQLRKDGSGHFRVYRPQGEETEWPLPLEAAAYVALEANETGHLPDLAEHGTFPQNSTVTMTFNSNSLLYGAYKDLARQHALAALKYVSYDGSAFLKAMNEQTRQIVAQPRYLHK